MASLMKGLCWAKRKSGRIVSGLRSTLKQSPGSRERLGARSRVKVDSALTRLPESPSRCGAMLRPILSIQSHVVYGHVGNSAAVFPLQRLGREVWPLMTVQFSSHAGYPGFKGRAFDAAMIDDCVGGLAANRVMARRAGAPRRLPRRPGIGDAALRALERIRAANPDAVY